MDYASVMKLVMKERREVALLEGEIEKHKVKIAACVEWMSTKARSEGLRDVPIKGVGTGYWQTALKATVANPSEFWAHVKEHDAFDLVENRASAKAVKSWIDGHNTPVPGVNFSQVEVFKIRAASDKGDEE